MKQYKVTSQMLNAYNKAIESGLSKAAACRSIGIAPTTMSDHLKRIESLQKYNYSIMKRSGIMSIIVNDNIYNMETSSTLYHTHKELIIDLINRDDYIMTQTEYNSLIGDADYKPAIKEMAIKSDNTLQLKNKKCYYKNKEVSNSLYNILVEVNKKKNANIIKFADHVLMNPDNRVVKQLFDFVQHNDITIDKEGYIIAFKAVNNSYRDFYSGRFDNSVGNVVTEDRSVMDSDPDKTCSRGLHVGSKSYILKITSYQKARLLECRVHPKDFVSIPTDYNGAKARVCEYTVLADVTPVT